MQRLTYVSYLHYRLGDNMPNIIGTIITIEKFLKNEEASVFIPQGNETGSPIILEKNRQYYIPDYQREVRWGKENIIELMSDINEGERFLGNIILSKRQNSTYEIIDGQQRITMLLMILKYIEFIAQESVTVFQRCIFKIDSFLKFQDLMNSFFDYDSLSEQKQEEINLSDTFNQRKRYCELWSAIKQSEIITRGTCRSFLIKLSRCEFNILLNTAVDGGYSIQYFLDVNLKGVRLDTEDILKSYLFSYDNSDDIRQKWKRLKENIFRIQNYTSKYTLVKVVEQFLYCDLFLHEPFKSSGIKFSDKFLLKSAKVINGIHYYKNDHMIKVINDNAYIRNSLDTINKYLDILYDVISTDGGVSAEFRDLFVLNGRKIVQDNEIKIIHNLIKKITLDDNVVPKILIMKYLLDVLINCDTPCRANIKKIYGIYCLSLLFTIFDDKRSSTQITDIVKMEDWNGGIIFQINQYLQSSLTAKRLAAKYTAMLLNSNDDTQYEDEWEDIDDIVALNNYQYRCKSLATIYNYFKINGNIVTVNNIDDLYTFLNDERLFSTEHFILNKSENYTIPQLNGAIPYPDRIKKYINSLFNFIFIRRQDNGELENRHIACKLSYLGQNPIPITCEYSRMVYEICNEVFANRPDISSLDNETDIRDALNNYYENTFLDDYTDYATKVIEKVIEKFHNN